VGDDIATPAPLPLLGRCRTQRTNTSYGDKTWVAGKTEPISSRVAASLGEPILLKLQGTRRGVPFWEDNRSAGTMAPSWRDPDLFPWGNIGLTRRGMPLWKDNRPDDTMTPSWRDPDLFPRVALALTVGQSAT